MIKASAVRTWPFLACGILALLAYAAFLHQTRPFIFLVFSTIFMLISLSRPHWGLMLLLTFLSGPLPINLTLQESIYIVCFLLSLLLLASLCRGFVQGRLISTRTSLDTLVLLFLTLALISALYGWLRGNRSVYLIGDLFHIMEFCAFFYVTTLIVKERNHIKVIVWGVLLSVLLGLSLNLFAYAKGDGTFWMAEVSGIEVPRLINFFVLVPLPVLFSLSFYSKSTKRRRLFKLATIFLIVCALLSFTRGIWLGGMIGLAFVLALSGVKGKLKSLFGYIAQVLIILCIGSVLLSRFNPAFSGFSLFYATAGRIRETVQDIHLRRHTFYVRGEEIRSAVRSISESPLLGVGLGGEYKTVHRVVTPLGEWTSGFESGRTHYIHNSYVEIALRMGFLALFVYLLLMFIYIREGISIFRVVKEPTLKGLALGFVASFVGLAATSLTSPSLLKHPLAAYVGVTMGLVYVIRHIRKQVVAVQ